jgi:hypothetical protein
MKPITDSPLVLEDFNLWVLSRAFMSDQEKYQKGLKYLEAAKLEAKSNFWPSRAHRRCSKKAKFAESLLEQALDREIDHYPYDDQQIFLLVETQLRNNGYTMGYNFMDRGLSPVDRKLEDDLTKLAHPAMYIERTPTSITQIDVMDSRGCIALCWDSESMVPHFFIKAGVGHSWGDYHSPSTISELPLPIRERRILRFAERAERVNKYLEQKLGLFARELSEKIKEYGKMYSISKKEICSLSINTELGQAWLQMMDGR